MKYLSTALLAAALLLSVSCSRQAESIPADAKAPVKQASESEALSRDDVTKGASAQEPAEGASGLEEVSFTIEGMHCPTCETLVETALKALPGVKSVDASRDSGVVKLSVEPGSVDRDLVAEAVKNAPGMSGKPGQFSVS